MRKHILWHYSEETDEAPRRSRRRTRSSHSEQDESGGTFSNILSHIKGMVQYYCNYLILYKKLQ